MSRYTGPRNRLARRFGANIFGTSRNPLAHKQNPPGQHGARRRKKSDYGVQLEEKQKLRACYGMISQKHLVRYFREAAQEKGNTQDNFIQRLECRLDIVVYRAKFAQTLFHAQQLVAHGQILVDGKKVDIRSFRVSPGMVVSLKEKARTNIHIKQALDRANVEVPEYISLDAPNFKAELLAMPHMDNVPLPLPINVAVVCEFLAHTT